MAAEPRALVAAHRALKQQTNMPPFTRVIESGAEGGSVPARPAAWREGLPAFADAGLTLRELEVADAPSLLAHVSTDEVSRFISPPPTSIEQFERFSRWGHRHRSAGRSLCFGIVPAGTTRAVGLFQLRSLEVGFVRAEWGFALGSAHWGTGLFVTGAAHVLDFAFETVGVQRLEARAAVINGRGNGALRKIGAVQEGVLRRSFLRHGEYYDQVLWSLLAEEWHRKRGLHRVRIH
jgi:[ribosomal protein S5]-alanine N-acetyltransferase